MCRGLGMWEGHAIDTSWLGPIPTPKPMLQRQIDATDRQIDRLVYELYGLTEEEIRIVEGATG